MLKWGKPLVRVVIDHLVDDRYAAKLLIADSGTITAFVSLVSEAVALAIRFDAPIFVTQGIIDIADQHGSSDA